MRRKFKIDKLGKIEKTILVDRMSSLLMKGKTYYEVDGIAYKMELSDQNDDSVIVETVFH